MKYWDLGLHDTSFLWNSEVYGRLVSVRYKSSGVRAGVPPCHVEHRFSLLGTRTPSEPSPPYHTLDKNKLSSTSDEYYVKTYWKINKVE